MRDIDFSARLQYDLVNRHIPSRTVDKNIFLINQDYSIAVGWKLELPCSIHAPEERLHEIHSHLKSALLPLPKHFDIQVVHSTDHQHTSIVEKVWQNSTGNKLQTEFIREQREQMQRRYESGELSNRTVYFYLVSSTNKEWQAHLDEASEKAKPRGIVERVKAFIKRLKSDLEPGSVASKNIAELEERENELQLHGDVLHQLFTSLNLNPDLMVADDFVELLFKRYSPQKYDRGDSPIRFRHDAGIPLPEHSIDEDLSWDNDGTIKIGDTYFRIYGLTMAPYEFQLPAMDRILYGSGIPNIEQITYAKQSDIEAWKKKLKKRLFRLKQEIDDHPERQGEYDQYYAELEQLGKGSEKIWSSGTFFLIWANSINDLKRYEVQLSSTARSNDTIITREKSSCFDYWRVIHPGWTRDRDCYRENLYNTDQLISMLPLCAAPNQLQYPVGACLETDVGTPYNINFHNDKRFSNYNWLAMGGSGSGKSFLFGTIAYNFKINYPTSKIIIVDLDGSYEGIAAAFGGNYITFDPDSSDQCINPFNLAPGKTKADNETIQMWRMDLEQRLADRSNGQDRLASEEISQIEMMLRDTVESSNGKEFILSDLRNAMESRSGLKKLSHRLSRWCQGGAYGNLCDGKTNIDLTNDFIVFDLKQITNNPELAPVIFTTVANLINQLGDRYMGSKKLLAFDEAWKILKDKHQQSFLELAFRAYRKKGFSVGGISQGISEWANLPNGEAFASNITNILISRLDASVQGSQMQTIQHFLNIPDSAISAISGLQTVPGEYAEVILVEKATTGTEVNKLINRPSPLFYALATTKPSDKAMIANIRESEGLSLLDAKIKFSQLYPSGV